MKKISLEIVGLSYSNSNTGSYVLVLGEVDSERRLPIIIGSSEAQAIAIELEEMSPSRPLTHDLFKTFADNFSIVVEEVLIYNLEAGVFFSKLRCKQGDTYVSIDARTSDAIALAVRFKCEITTTENIMDEAGVLLEEEPILDHDADAPQITVSELQDFDVTIEDASEEQLRVWLAEAIENEDYEYASQIRDELNNRNLL